MESITECKDIICTNLNHPKRLTLKKLMERVIRSFPQPPKCFEWGCGQTTLHVMRRCSFAEWISIENNKIWFDDLNQKLAKHASHKLIYAPPSDTTKGKEYWYDMEHRNPHDVGKYFQRYINAIKPYSPDVILIDGRARLQCLDASYDYIAYEGIAVIHDAHRIDRCLSDWQASLSLWPRKCYVDGILLLQK